MNLDEYGFYSYGPISLEKPPGVIRIFLMGGSGVIGSGQHGRFSDVHDYPKGVFSYPISIAGYLKAYLHRHVPTQKFEVITAASFNRVLHQSFLLYLETISRFSPDYVVNVDGFNDVYTFVNGRPYAYAEERLPNLIKLYVDYTDPPAFKQLHVYQLGKKVLGKVAGKVGDSILRKQGSSRGYDHDRYPEDLYLRHRTSFVENASRFLQILNQYMAVLRADDVRFIFVLQPILHRSTNKALSRIETTMVETHYPRWHPEPESFERANLVYKYFFDDYLSSEIERHVRKYGHYYLDSNLAIRDLRATFEFYTDYCHLTPRGNEHIAELLGVEIAREYQLGS